MKNLVRASAALAVVLAAAPAFASAQTRTFVVHDNGGSRAQFVSDAPLETITGVSSRVSGRFETDARNLARTRGHVEIPVASVRSGIDLRDEHLRGENWLDAAHHPTIRFDIVGVEGATALTPNQTANLRIRGRVTIHGETRNVTADAQVRYMPVTEQMRQAQVNADVILVHASFSIRLTDFGVTVPLPVQLKVSNEITVNVTVRGTAEG